MKITETIIFYDCEHGGDLERYEADVRKSGAKITRSFCDDDGSGVITIELERTARAAFFKAFAKTESYDSSDLAD